MKVVSLLTSILFSSALFAAGDYGSATIGPRTMSPGSVDASNTEQTQSSKSPASSEENNSKPIKPETENATSEGTDNSSQATQQAEETQESPAADNQSSNKPTASKPAPKGSKEGKTIGDHFLSLNPFKSKKQKNGSDSDALFPEDDIYSNTDVPSVVDRPHKVKDLAYGEILLDYYSNRNYKALVRARMAQEQNELNENSNHTDLLLAQLYILEGLPSKAEESLNKILKKNLSASTRNRALFQLARIYSYQGNLDSAKRILATELQNLSGLLELDRKVLLVNIHSKQKNKEAVKKILESLSPDDTRNFYTKFNIASAGLLVEEFETSIPLLISLSSGEHTDLESRSVKDTANLSLGHYHLKRDELEEAKNYFSKISYVGPHSNEALYFLAWIALKQDQTKIAFALWVDLSKRNPADLHVGKSFLIRPYTLEKLNSSHLALSGYLRASELYEKLISDVDNTIEVVNSDIWLQKLHPGSLDSISMYEKIAKQPGWIKTQKNEANFLIDLYSSDQFALIHQNFWELELSNQNLKKQRKKFTVFELQQSTHDEKFDRLVPEAQVMMSSDRNQGIQDRLEAIENEVKQVTELNNFLAAPTQEQLNRLEKIKYLKSVLDNEPADQYLDQRRYLSMLEGINAWDMSQDVYERQWKIRQQYQELSKLLKQTEQHRSQILAGIEKANYYEVLMPRINRVSDNLELKIQQTELLSLKLQKLMRSQALEILEARRKEYKTLRVRAKLAAARLQDSIVTKGKK